MKKIFLLLTSCILLLTSLHAQRKQTFTHADTLRGSITPERAWWDVLHYDITVKPDFNNKTLAGHTVIRYKVVSANHPDVMQVDLQKPLIIDSIVFNNSKHASFKNNGD